MNEMYILVINTGSTSTKYAIYKDEQPVFIENVQHQKEELSGLADVDAQQAFRTKVILGGVEKKGFDLKLLSAVVGRGGLTGPIPGGTFIIERNMLDALHEPSAARHASSLSPMIAHEIATQLGLPCYTVDSVVTDELEPVARVSGFEGVERISILHALNQKAIARRAAADLGKAYDACRLIVAHMGGGVSVGGHVNGRVIDVNNALDGEGPFSPERAGGLPVCSVIELCFSGQYTKQELSTKLIKQGGFVSYLGTNDGRKVEEMAKTDPKAKLVLDAFIYQTAKEIGGMAAALDGEVEAVVLTGGLAYSKVIVEDITKKVGFIAKVLSYPGEDELLALTQGALRALRGEETPKTI